MSILAGLRSFIGHRFGGFGHGRARGGRDLGPALTGSFRGLNWADTRDNFQEGVLYLSGLSASDTYGSASKTAAAILDQMYALTGANTVRLPINEATVATYWDTYTGVIDTALAKGRVILCYWAAKNGRPADVPAFKRMWSTVVARYGPNENAFFEPINEPCGFKPRELNDFYFDWRGAFPAVPGARVVLDGSGYAERPATVGEDPRLADCLLGYHQYAFFGSFGREADWQRRLQDELGDCYPRTLCTEFGAVMNAGSLDGKTQYPEPPDYRTPSNDKFVVFVRGVTDQFRVWGIGSVYWPGIRDGDIYRLCTRAGEGAATTLTIDNASGLSRIRYGWGEDGPLGDAPAIPASDAAPLPGAADRAPRTEP